MRPLGGRVTQPGFLLLAYVPPECTPFLPPWLAHSTPLFFSGFGGGVLRVFFFFFGGSRSGLWCPLARFSPVPLVDRCGALALCSFGSEA